MNENKLGQEPAFPCEHFPQDSTIEGMSKRFYAACAAMQGLISNPENKGTSQACIRLSYEIADELLRQENL